MSEANSVQNLYKCTPREVRTFTADCVEAGLVPFIRSSPGMGKSSIVRDTSTEFGLELIDERLSTRSPVDLAGLPNFLGDNMNQRASWIPFDTYPIEGTPLPKGKNGWTLFFDEFNSAQKSVQAAAYKIVLDRMVGQHKLHPYVAIICAGNLETDRAITNPLSTAMQSRLVHIEMELSHREWLEDVALKQNYDSRLIAFLNFQSKHLMDFRPDHNEKTFCCPRTWEFVNRAITGKADLRPKTKLLAGMITSGVAVEFVNFVDVFHKLPTLRMILADPAGATVPDDPPSRWAVISSLMEKVTKDNFKDIITYVNRFTTEFRVLFFRSILVRQPSMRTHPEFAKAMSGLSKYLHGE